MKDRFAKFIDWILDGSDFMVAVSGIRDAAEILKVSAFNLSGKLDQVGALVQSLKDQVAAGGGVSQEEVDAILAAMSEAQSALDASKSKVSAVLGE